MIEQLQSTSHPLSPRLNAVEKTKSLILGSLLAVLAPVSTVKAMTNEAKSDLGQLFNRIAKKISPSPERTIAKMFHNSLNGCSLTCAEGIYDAKRRVDNGVERQSMDEQAPMDPHSCPDQVFTSLCMAIKNSDKKALAILILTEDKWEHRQRIYEINSTLSYSRRDKPTLLQSVFDSLQSDPSSALENLQNIRMHASSERFSMLMLSLALTDEEAKVILNFVPTTVEEVAAKYSAK